MEQDYKRNSAVESELEFDVKQNVQLHFRLLVPENKYTQNLIQKEKTNTTKIKKNFGSFKNLACSVFGTMECWEFQLWKLDS